MGFASDCWHWRSQIWHLAVTELVKTCRGAVLGWAWLFVKPIVYIGVFWFALAFGLRAGEGFGDCPYIVWLACGLVPWFFMSDMVNAGSNVYRRYPYLVNKIKFPLVGISAFYVLSKCLVYMASFLVLVAACLVAGVSLFATLLQVPFVALAMYAFFVLWSAMTSPLSAVSKDFANLVKTLGTPLFWISGVIYDVAALDVQWIKAVLAFNPVTFFVEAHRMALCSGQWVWENPGMLASFLVVLAATALCAVVVQRRMGAEVADAL